MMPQTADFIFSILHALDDSSASTIHKEWKEEFCEMTMSIVHSLSTSYGISRFLSPSRDPGVSRPARPLRSPLPRSSFTCIASSACSAPSPSDRSTVSPTLSTASRLLRDDGGGCVFRSFGLRRRRASLHCF